MTTSWPVVPLWSFTEDVRSTIDPTKIAGDVFHYSIPVVDQTGTGRVEAASDVDSAKLLLVGGEVLISKLNPRKGRILISQPHELPIVASPEFIALRNTGAVVDRFLAYLLASETTRLYLDARVQSVTRSHQRVTPELVRRLPVSLPPLDEQRRIADFLDAETARLNQVQALQGNVRSAIASRRLAQLDLVMDRLSEADGTLPFRRMFGSIEQGISPQCDNVAAEPDAWGVLKVSAVNNGSFVESENKQLPTDIEPVSRYEIRNGDLLITRANTPSLVGAAAVVDFTRSKLMLCDKIFRVTTTPDLLPRFLVLVSLSTKIRSMCAAASHGTSASMANLKTEEIKRWPIPQVPISVQREVVAELLTAHNQAAALIDVIDRQLDLLAERRQALITSAVTGQIDVTTARGVDV